MATVNINLPSFQPTTKYTINDNTLYYNGDGRVFLPPQIFKNNMNGFVNSNVLTDKGEAWVVQYWGLYPFIDSSQRDELHRPIQNLQPTRENKLKFVKLVYELFGSDTSASFVEQIKKDLEREIVDRCKKDDFKYNQEDPGTVDHVIEIIKSLKDHPPAIKFNHVFNWVSSITMEGGLGWIEDSINKYIDSRQLLIAIPPVSSFPSLVKRHSLIKWAIKKGTSGIKEKVKNTQKRTFGEVLWMEDGVNKNAKPGTPAHNKYTELLRDPRYYVVIFGDKRNVPTSRMDYPAYLVRKENAVVDTNITRLYMTHAINADLSRTLPELKEMLCQLYQSVHGNAQGMGAAASALSLGVGSDVEANLGGSAMTNASIMALAAADNDMPQLGNEMGGLANSSATASVSNATDSQLGVGELAAVVGGLAAARATHNGNAVLATNASATAPSAGLAAARDTQNSVLATNASTMASAPSASHEQLGIELATAGAAQNDNALSQLFHMDVAMTTTQQPASNHSHTVAVAPAVAPPGEPAPAITTQQRTEAQAQPLFTVAQPSLFTVAHALVTDLQSEQYELVSIVSVTDLKKKKAAKCDDCNLVACCTYIGGIEVNTFSYCLNCQEKHFAGWPDIKELPFAYLSSEHRNIITKKCSTGNASFPNVSYYPDEGAKSYVTGTPVYHLCSEPKCDYICCGPCLSIRTEKDSTTNVRSTRKRGLSSHRPIKKAKTTGVCHSNPYSLTKEQGRSYFTKDLMMSNNREKCLECGLWFRPE